MTDPAPTPDAPNAEPTAGEALTAMPTTHVLDHRAKVVLTPYQLERLLQLPADFRVTGVTVTDDPLAVEVRLCSYSLPHELDDETETRIVPLQTFVPGLAPAPAAGPVAAEPEARPVWGQIDPSTGRSRT